MANPDLIAVSTPTADPRLARMLDPRSIAVLGASSYTFAEATWTQTLPDWIGSHVRMFAFFGGVPRLIVPDNLKSGVNRASFHDPEINRSYGMMASHYGIGVLPARPRRPKDKAKVENAVLIVERWILVRLRKRVFTSLTELNAAIRELLVDLNNRPFQKLPGSRCSQFEEIDRPAQHVGHPGRERHCQRVVGQAKLARTGTPLGQMHDAGQRFIGVIVKRRMGVGQRIAQHLRQAAPRRQGSADLGMTKAEGMAFGAAAAKIQRRAAGIERLRLWHGGAHQQSAQRMDQAAAVGGLLVLLQQARERTCQSGAILAVNPETGQ